MSVRSRGPRPLPRGSSVAVIGAGIIGTSTAFALAERGYKVTLYDRAPPGSSGASRGNGGHVVGSGIFPLAEPGAAWSGLKMLLDPDAPLKIPAAHAVRLAPWLWRFWQSSRGEAHERGIAALTGLSLGGVDETEAFWQRAGIGDMLQRVAALYLYESEQSAAASERHWQRRAEAGMASTHVGPAEIEALEPYLAPIFPRGVLSHDWGVVTDPFEVVVGLFRAAQRLGVVHERAEVSLVEARGDLVAVTSQGVARLYDGAVIAAGAWSKPLAQRLGEDLPVEAERGYNLTFAGRQGLINRPLVLADRGVTASPLQPGLRLGGWTELGGTDLPPNASRWERMTAISETVIPALRGTPSAEWMGHRPSMPDSVPVVSRSTQLPGVFYAVGHGHYGLSQSAMTARILSEIISEAADARYAPYGLGRFNP